MTMKKTNKKAVVFMAYMHRFGWIPLMLIIAAVFREAAEFIISIGMILYGAWTLYGYWHRWDHIYCSWQHSDRMKMTPEKIEWDKVDVKDGIGVSILLIVLGAVYLAVVLMWG